MKVFCHCCSQDSFFCFGLIDLHSGSLLPTAGSFKFIKVIKKLIIVTIFDNKSELGRGNDDKANFS